MAEWRPERVEDYWRFVVARHEMFLARCWAKLPPPWTDDPALAKGHYTCVYRELDRVTIDLQDQVLRKSGLSFGLGATHYQADRLYNVILYRIFNLPETYAALGGFQPTASWDLDAAERLLLKRAKAGRKIWTGAFMVNAASGKDSARWAVPGGKIKLWIERLRTIRREMVTLWPALKDLCRQYEHETSPAERWLIVEEAHYKLTQLPGIGRFLAYEILVDACYGPRILPFSENDWVNAGPGAKLGLAEMLAEKPRGERAWAEAIVDLQENQREMRAKAGVVLRGPHLTCRNAEHCLCEYAKYLKIKAGIRGKRNYTPSSVSSDLSPWDGLDERYWTTPVCVPNTVV